MPCCSGTILDLVPSSLVELLLWCLVYSLHPCGQAQLLLVVIIHDFAVFHDQRQRAWDSWMRSLLQWHCLVYVSVNYFSIDNQHLDLWVDGCCLFMDSICQDHRLHSTWATHSHGLKAYRIFHHNQELWSHARFLFWKLLSQVLLSRLLDSLQIFQFLLPRLQTIYWLIIVQEICVLDHTEDFENLQENLPEVL